MGFNSGLKGLRNRMGGAWTGLLWPRIGRDKWRALVNGVMNDF
jgi:hypothetical protein